MGEAKWGESRRPSCDRVVAMKPRFYFLIVIFSFLLLLHGLRLIFLSFPLETLISAVKAGGIYVPGDKVHVQGVAPSSPAALSGLQVGDVILEVSDQKVSDSQTFIDLVDRYKGRSVQMLIDRDGEFEIVKLIPRLDPPPGEGSIGVIISNLSLKKQPILSIVTRVVIEAYSGQERDIKVFEDRPLFKFIRFYRLYFLAGGVLSILLTIGLLKLRRWSLYVVFVIALISLYRLLSLQINFSLVGVGDYLVDILFAIYAFSQRKFFISAKN